MKALALMVQTLWPRLKFLESSSKVKVKGHKVRNIVSNGKVSSKGIIHVKYESRSSKGLEVMAKVKFLKVA